MRSASTVAQARQAQAADGRLRRVGHAMLKPAHPDDAAQLRFAVEDALATADFGDAGRLVLLRRLTLTGLPPRAEPALVARVMESAWRATARAAVPALSPAAAQADAVFFGSRFEARLACLERLARAELPRQWFWPAALPELKALPSTEAAAVIDTVTAAALQDSGPALLRSLARWSDEPLAALMRRMSDRTQARLLPLLVAEVSLGPPKRAATRDGGAAVQAQSREDAEAVEKVVRRLAARRPLPEAGARTLAALWLAPALGRRPSMQEVLVVQVAVFQALRPAGRGAGPAAADPGMPPEPRRTAVLLSAEPMPAGPGREAGPAPACAADAPPTSPRPPEPEAALARPAGEPPQPSPPQVGAVPAQRLAPGPAEASWPWLADAAFTPFGGLLLLLNLLAALHFDRWLQALPPGARLPSVQALMRHCLEAAGAAADEPQQAWFAEPDGDPSDAPGEISAGGASEEATPAPISLRMWRLRLRRTLRRHAGMDLAELLRRPGWVSATPTHIDVIFPLEEVDLRLRRLGLDVDPGWVPWFGRIVTFHFMPADRLPPIPRPAHGAAEREVRRG